jgi:hypothetical protein
MQLYAVVLHPTAFSVLTISLASTELEHVRPVVPPHS